MCVSTDPEAAAIPLAAMTAAIGLYLRLALPEPWRPATEPIPLVIYGAASAVGVYAIQLARRSNIHPLICVAGRAKDYVETLIDRSKGDTIIDYRNGDEAVVAGLKKALEGRPLLHAFDAVSEKGSYVNLSKVLEKGAKITLVLPGKEYSEIPITSRSQRRAFRACTWAVRLKKTSALFSSDTSPVVLSRVGSRRRDRRWCRAAWEASNRRSKT